jgi:tol-pal system protein YbgF
MLLLALTACASTGDSEALRRDADNVMRDSPESKKEVDSLSDFDRLRRDADNLKRDSSEFKKEIDSLKERTARAAKEESFIAFRESLAEINTRVYDLAGGLQELRGRFEESKYYQEKILKDSTTEKDIIRAQVTGIELQLKALKDKLVSLEEAVKTREPVRTQSDSLKPETEKPDQTPDQAKAEDSSIDKTADKKDSGDDRAKTYDSAYQAFKDKKYREAREKFEAFIKDSPRHKLAGNSQFWIAETYYAEKDYESAILAYETLLKKYPDSEKTIGALLKQGFAFVDISDNKTGKAILEKLVQKYPESKEAGLARKKLAEIDKQPGKKK